MSKNIVLCGIQEQGKDIIRFLYEKGIRVTHVVTISEEIAIRNKSESTWVSYEDIARELAIELYYAESYSLSTSLDINYFKDRNFYILLLGGWQRLIPKEILNTIHYPIGQHGSSEFLPEGRGRSPLNWAIILGKKRLIWNLFLLTPMMDEGDILDYHIFEIREQDDCQTLYYKVSVSVKYMLARTIPKLLDNSLSPTPQIGDSSYYPKRTADDGRIDWTKSIYEINNLIRAVTHPYPGAFTECDTTKIMIWRAQIWDTFIDFYKNNSYGSIVEIFGTSFVVKCYDGLLLITEHDDTNVFKNKTYV